jgi:hypothetical protein
MLLVAILGKQEAHDPAGALFSHGGEGMPCGKEQDVPAHMNLMFSRFEPSPP